MDRQPATPGRLALALCALASLACSDRPPDFTLEDLEASAAAPGLPLVDRSVVFGECEDGPCVVLTLPVPAGEGGPAEREAAAALQAWALAPLHGGEQSGDASRIAEEFIARNPGWAAKRRYRIDFQSRDLLCLVRVDEIHNFMRPPLLLSDGLVLDARTGRRLGLADLFAPGSRAELDERAEQAFREDRGLPPGESLAGDWRFEGGRFSVSEDFRVSETAITFEWDPYEIGPGAAGAPSVTLPWELVADLLRADAPVPGRLELGLAVGQTLAVDYDSWPSTFQFMDHDIDDESVLSLHEDRVKEKPARFPARAGGDRRRGTWIFRAEAPGVAQLRITRSGRTAEERLVRVRVAAVPGG